MTHDWQPIETAPEHTSIIVFAPWPDGHPFRGEGFLDWDGTWRWADGRPIVGRQAEPTHWMELPDPPSVARPDLERRLRESAEEVKRMTPEQRSKMIAAQRRSWVIGEMMLAHPDMTIEEARRIYDAII